MALDLEIQARLTHAPRAAHDDMSRDLPKYASVLSHLRVC
jgi:hypothetical protein